MTGAEYRRARSRDLIGRVGVLTREVETKGGIVVPEGTVVTVDGKRKGGLAVTLPACATCGLRFRCVGLEPHTVDLLPVGTPAPAPPTEGRAHWTARPGGRT